MIGFWMIYFFGMLKALANISVLDNSGIGMLTENMEGPGVGCVGGCSHPPHVETIICPQMKFWA